MRVTQAQVDGGTIERTGAHEFLADASDLGIPPGPPPRKIETDIGNGKDFWLTERWEWGWVYMQIAGCVMLRVQND